MVNVWLLAAPPKKPRRRLVPEKARPLGLAYGFVACCLWASPSGRPECWTPSPRRPAQDHAPPGRHSNPQINAFGTSTLIRAGDQKVMIDCGRGTAIGLSQIGLGVGCVDTIIVSHYHSDHYAGLFDMAMTGSIPQKFGGRNAPLRCCPPGIKDIAEGAACRARPRYQGRRQRDRP